MATEVLNTSERTPDLSKGELMKERKQGRVPAVVFGQNMKSKPLFVDGIEFQKMFDKHGKIFELQVGKQKKLVNAKSIQFDPMRQFIWHVDFQVLKKGVETTVKIPVSLIGDAEGFKDGGSIQQRQNTLMVTGKPKDLPESIEVDISKLKIGDNIHVSDIKLSKELKLETDSELTIATVVAPQKVEEETTPEALNTIESDETNEMVEAKNIKKEDS